MNQLKILVAEHESLIVRVGFLTAIAVVCLGIHFWERRKERHQQQMDAFKRHR